MERHFFSSKRKHCQPRSLSRTCQENLSNVETKASAENQKWTTCCHQSGTETPNPGGGSSSHGNPEKSMESGRVYVDRRLKFPYISTDSSSESNKVVPGDLEAKYIPTITQEGQKYYGCKDPILYMK